MSCNVFLIIIIHVHVHIHASHGFGLVLVRSSISLNIKYLLAHARSPACLMLSCPCPCSHGVFYFPLKVCKPASDVRGSMLTCHVNVSLRQGQPPPTYVSRQVMLDALALAGDLLTDIWVYGCHRYIQNVYLLSW